MAGAAVVLTTLILVDADSTTECLKDNHECVHKSECCSGCCVEEKCKSFADNCNAALSPCAVHACPPGKVCYLQQVQCIAAPCHAVPACRDQDYDYNWFTTPVQLISWPTDFRIPSSFLGGHDFETQLEAPTVAKISSSETPLKCCNTQMCASKTAVKQPTALQIYPTFIFVDSQLLNFINMSCFLKTILSVYTGTHFNSFHTNMCFRRT